LIANFYDEQPAKYVFQNIKNLNCPDLKEMFTDVRDDVDKQIRLCLAQEIDLSLEEALRDFTELLEKDRITIPTRLCILMEEYLIAKKSNEISKELLADYIKRIYDWLQKNQESKEGELVLRLVTRTFLFSKINLNGLETVAQHAIRNDFVPFHYLNWWLKEEAENVVQEQRYLLLDEFWSYSFRYSNITDNKYNEYLIYKRYFLYLLEMYPIAKDMIWWSLAVKELLKFYNQLVTGTYSSRYKKRIGKFKEDSQYSRYHQRLCLEQIMETILHICSLEEDVLQLFTKNVAHSLSYYSNKLWAIRWLVKINSDIDIDVTQLFLDYLSSIEYVPNIIQSNDILNHSNWWIECLTESRLDKTAEFERLWAWIDQTPTPNVSIFLIPALLKKYPNILHKFDFCNIIKKIIEEVNADFDSKSKLISDYLIWLKKVPDVNEREKHLLHELLTWLLENINSYLNTRTAVYGFQDLLQAAIRYDLDFNIQTMQRVFLKILEETTKITEIELESSGKIAKHYFDWLFNKSRNIDIYVYLNWINDNYDKPQTPYILMYLAEFLSKRLNNYNPSIDDLESIWEKIKLLIEKRFVHEGTCIAAQHYMEVLSEMQKVESIDKNKVSKISEDFFQSCLQLSDNSNVIYLLISFIPYWNNLVNIPSDKFMELWEKIFPKGYHSIENFNLLTRKFNSHLQQKNEEELIIIFHKKLVDFIENNPGHLLSPKFAKILILSKFQFDTLFKHIIKMLHSQKSLHELKYILIEFFPYLHERIELVNERIEHETCLFENLKENLSKPYSARCLSIAIEKCTPKVHYKLITDLVEKFLKLTIKTEEKFWYVLQEYRRYEETSETDESVRRNVIEKFLEIIFYNAKREKAAIYFSEILKLWESNVIPLESAINTLRQIILRTDPSKLERIHKISKYFEELFGPDTLISSNVSIKAIIDQIHEHKEGGLLAIRKQLY